MLSGSFFPYKLVFRFDAGTSRGVLREKTSWFIRIRSEDQPGVFGLGECGPLPNLSPDHKPYLSDRIKEALKKIAEWEDMPQQGQIGEKVASIVPAYLPAVSFAIETALLDLSSGGKRMIIKNDFVLGKLKTPINGLVWMGEKDFMLRQIREKLEAGYTCIKIKVGAIDPDAELDMLKYIRKRFSTEAVTIRLDANGAFKPGDALQILERFSAYGIHSVEQPIQAGHRRAMRRLCRKSPIPIALDEELIGITGLEQKLILLDEISPQYIILKPTLVGGLYATGQWVELAEQRSIGWWVTSALESNIGLNAIAQYTAGFRTGMHQGLGTGQLYRNNIQSPLFISRGYLGYDPQSAWDLGALGI